jgi:uncharacterized lipoprotein YajG
MRTAFLIVPLSALLLLAACGTTHKTVVVNPPSDSSVIVKPNGDTKVVPN